MNQKVKMSAKGHLQLQAQQSDDEESMATMQQASRIASIEPPRPPIRAVSQPVSSSVSNDDYEEISVDTLVKVPQADIQSFRDYLQHIPFRYNDVIHTVLGRHLEREGDVRLFFDSSRGLAHSAGDGAHHPGCGFGPYK
jgi:hypothetical protein